jgi:hypothetical protein
MPVMTLPLSLLNRRSSFSSIAASLSLNASGHATRVYRFAIHLTSWDVVPRARTIAVDGVSAARSFFSMRNRP